MGELPGEILAFTVGTFIVVFSVIESLKLTKVLLKLLNFACSEEVSMKWMVSRLKDTYIIDSNYFG